MLNAQLLIKSGLPAIAIVAVLAWDHKSSAGPFDCSFDVDTCGFGLLNDSPPPSTSVVNNGRLEMHTQGSIYNVGPGTSPGLIYPTAAEIYVHQTYNLRYSRPWETSVWVEIPNSLEPNLPYGPINMDELHLQVGIAVTYFLPDSSFYSFTTSLLFNSDFSEKQRQYDADSKYNPVGGSQTVHVDTDLLSLDENGTVGIRFDPLTKTLTGFNATQDILSVDIDTPGTDWGMTNSDSFNVAILLEARGVAVPDTAPLAVDDFVVNQVPLPAPIAMLAGASAMLLFAGQRPTRRKRDIKS